MSDRIGNKITTLLITVTAVLALFVSCQKTDHAETVKQHKALAGELRDNKLYAAAIEEYEAVLALPDIDTGTRGNINYLIARVYFEDLKDYEKAAAYYLRARSFDPEGSFIDEASRNLVASLEKLGHYMDARRELDAVTDIDSQPKDKDDIAVARIGGETVWLSQVDEQIQSLPPDVQKQFLSREAKLDFVRQYVGAELLYHAALREGYDRDPEIVKKKDLIGKRLLVDKFVVEKVMPEVKIDTLDVRNFYLANKDSRYDSAPYDSVKAQVFLDYQSDKANAAYSNYIAKLAEAQKVEFLDHNVK
ncbi:MAG: tetratricopeptide repeat protein [Candidatus Zixiibacteriota bacterium]